MHFCKCASLQVHVTIIRLPDIAKTTAILSATQVVLTVSFTLSHEKQPSVSSLLGDGSC